MKTKKSAKDIAFDREREKFRHEIRCLNSEIKENLQEIEKLSQIISKLQESIRQRDDWIRRLLEYTELTEEDMKKKIQKDKDVSDALESLENLNALISGACRMFVI